MIAFVVADTEAGVDTDRLFRNTSELLPLPASQFQHRTCATTESACASKDPEKFQVLEPVVTAAS